MRPRLRLIGSVLRPRSVDEKVAIMKSFKRRFLGNLLDGSLKPIIDSVYPVETGGGCPGPHGSQPQHRQGHVAGKGLRPAQTAAPAPPRPPLRLQ